MRWSRSFIPTLRDAPADAEAASHKLLVRGGFIRQLHAGHYTLLPLGRKVHEKVAQIVREEMDAIGGQEFSMPALHPASLWQRSGRWELMGEEMFRLEDRKEAPLALGMTHEEVIALLAGELSSYRELPQIWYQIQTKFRDEPRPKAGLLRVREFAMKDSYSIDLDEGGLDVAFDLHHDAYVKIFARLGVDAFAVEASSGAMGGSASVEFMVPSPSGEDDVARCSRCGYAANVERARAALAPIDDEPTDLLPTRFATPGIVTVAALAEVEPAAAPDHQIKTLVMIIDGEVILALVRGDHQLNEQKLRDATGAVALRPAESEEVFAALGAHPGSLGAVGVSHLRVIADEALRGRTNLTTGANEDGFHLRHVDMARDLAVTEWADLRQVAPGEPCPNCGTAIEVVRCIEAGHIFKLGRKYTTAFGVTVLDAGGTAKTPIMGSYGIGIGRNVAAIAEQHHDDKGLIWPMAVAPYHVVVTVVNVDDAATVAAAETVYRELRAAGVDALLDDRDARPGVKFADAELIGIPLRLTIGPKSLAQGEMELAVRASGERSTLPLADAARTVAAMVHSA
jgi:prolyl-tRNA synthetase